MVGGYVAHHRESKYPIAELDISIRIVVVGFGMPVHSFEDDRSQGTPSRDGDSQGDRSARLKSPGPHSRGQAVDPKSPGPKLPAQAPGPRNTSASPTGHGPTPSDSRAPDAAPANAGIPIDAPAAPSSQPPDSYSQHLPAPTVASPSSHGVTSGPDAQASPSASPDFGTDSGPNPNPNSLPHSRIDSGPGVGGVDPGDAALGNADREEVVGFWPVLQNRNFLTLWGGQVFSQLADKVYLVLMIALVSQNFEAPGQTISGWVSAVMIAFTIPAILFGSVAGVYVDRHPKRRVLVASNLFRGGLVLALPLLLGLALGWGQLSLEALGWGSVPIGFCMLLLITFLVSTLTQFFAPAEQAAIPLLVDQKHLLSANSLYTTTMMAAMIVGFAIGEPLLNLADRWLANGLGLGSGKALLVGGAYGIAGLLLMVIRVQESPEHLADADRHPWQDLKEGWSYLSTHPLIRAALVQLIILFSIVAALSVLAVRLAEVIPQLDADQFGWLLSVGSVGMGLGAVVVGQFCSRFPRRRVVGVGTLGLAASLAGLALVCSHLLPTLACITVLGFFAALVGIPMQTTIQEETPPEMRGKVFGLQNNAINIALSLPLALAGVAESHWGLPWTLGGLALLTLLGGVVTPKGS